MIPRSLTDVIFSDQWGRQMRFIAGPRQCGKTTLAKTFLKQQGDEAFYYNWDDRELRTRFHRSDFLEEDLRKAGVKKNRRWVCYDEIHKMPQWKNILKAHFDRHEEQIGFIVTGSARLDFFRRSGDSLTGRYFLFRLFPLNLFEMTRKAASQRLSFLPSAQQFLESRMTDTKTSDQDAMTALLRFGGFPEPFLKADPHFSKIWQRNYLDRLIREDLRDLTRISELENVAALISLLPERIGSPLSVNSLREDLLVSHETIRNYLNALRLCYFIFEVPSYGKKINRILKKEKKIYFHDWSLLEDPGKRFENYVAAELYNWTCEWHDSGLGNFNLFYVKTRDGRECDFLIVKDSKPWLLIEAKLKAERAAPYLLHFAQTLGHIPFVQVVEEQNILRIGKSRDCTLSASRFFSA
jgi:hypothetical protein